MMSTVPCASCGVEFGVPETLLNARRKDGASFLCPNGHSNVFRPTPDQQKIVELERDLANARRIRDDTEGWANELYAARENLIGVLKECIVPGCPWRSRKQISRDEMHMGRGIERVRRDLIEHLVHDHGAGGHVADRPRLDQRTPDEPIEAVVVDG